MDKAGVAVFVTLVTLSMIASSQATTAFSLPRLPYAYDALENYIDNRTMVIHHTRHHQAAVDGLNAALRSAPNRFVDATGVRDARLDLLFNELGSKQWSSIPANVSRAIRNNAGSHFNHAMFWRIMRPHFWNNDRKRPANKPSHHLHKAIKKTFRSTKALETEFSDQATRLFGSGWTWLIVTKKGKLAIVTTPNQDNPLMKNIVEPAVQGIPILGLDVWEHAYYLKHQNVRRNYIEAWWKVVNWPHVSTNYKHALKGDVEKIWSSRK